MMDVNPSIPANRLMLDVVNINMFGKIKSLDCLRSKDYFPGGGGGGIFGRGVPPGSPNPDPISDQNIPFSTPVYRPGL